MFSTSHNSHNKMLVVEGFVATGFIYIYIFYRASSLYFLFSKRCLIGEFGSIAFNTPIRHSTRQSDLVILQLYSKEQSDWRQTAFKICKRTCDTIEKRAVSNAEHHRLEGYVFIKSDQEVHIAVEITVLSVRKH